MSVLCKTANIITDHCKKSNMDDQCEYIHKLYIQLIAKNRIEYYVESRLDKKRFQIHTFLLKFKNDFNQYLNDVVQLLPGFSILINTKQQEK